MAVDYNAIVPIPEEANVPKRSGGRVFVVTKRNYLQEKHYNVDSRISIGISIDERRMHPNQSYKLMYPQLYNEHVPYDKKLPGLIKIIGPYSAFLAVGQHTGLYNTLIESFGPQNANMIMDYGAYSILTHTNVAKDFAETMQEHLLFSKKAYSDSWLSDFFKNKMTEEQGKLFRDNWIMHCQKQGVTAAWICIDGSNDDCDAANMFEAEPGYDKSGNKGPIVSYMWAVSSKDGMPITYLPYRGSRVDAVALKEMVAYLDAFGITTQGVILDRGFWNMDDILCLQEAELDFIIMMKGGHGYDQMLNLHGETLRGENVHYMLNRSGSYGLVDTVEVFKDKGISLPVALMYSNTRAAKSINTLTDKVKVAITDAMEKIRRGEPYTIEASVLPYVIVRKYRGRKKDTIELDEERLQQSVNRMGFAALAMSKEMTAQEVDDIYALRQFSEKQYAAFKTQLGYDVMRVYTPESWKSKFACGFVAGIIRNDFENRCRKANSDANSALKELRFVVMTRIRDKYYVYVRMMSGKAKAILAEHGIHESDMNLIVESENARLDGTTIDPIRQLPKRDVVKRGPGRPKGSRNKKSLAKATAKSQEKRKPGRPKGSKNKSTTNAHVQS